MSSFGAILDANVLIQAGPRDTLLRAAEKNLYRPFWTEEILGEVERNLTKIRAKKGHPNPDNDAKRVTNTLREVFPEALVEGYEALTASMTNSPDDRHVLAAAVASQAQAIITDNLKDFPPTALAPYRIEALSADTFLADLFDLNPMKMLRILIEQGADLQHPRSLEEVLANLEQHVPVFVEAVRQHSW